MKLHLTTTALLLLLCAPAGLAAQGRLERFAPTPVFRTSWRGFDTGTQASARWPWAARAADLDGDGRPEIAVVDCFGIPKLGILRNKGDGSLAAPVQYSIPRGALDLVVADFTLDGAPDIAVANSGTNGEGNTVSLFRNLGDGSFATGVQSVVGSGSFVNPVGLAAADFSGDGRVDLCVARYGYLGQGTQVALLVNNGTGGFLPAASFPSGDSPYKLAAGDLDDDGRPDLVVARDEQKLSVLRGTGTGFAPPVSYDVLGYFNTDVYQAIELADVDLDLDLDVLYSSTTTSLNFLPAIALMRNQGDGTLSPAEPLLLASSSGGAIDLAAGDVDGDGWPDILGATDARWTLMRGDGSGGFLEPEVFGATEIPVAVELADMDGDENLDPVVLGRESLEVAVYHNAGSGDFGTPAPRQVTSSVPAVARGTDAADIDGDGDLDVAVASSPVLTNSGGVSILRGNGDGTFGAPLEYPSPKHAIYAKLADLSGDGKPDLLWADDAPTYDVKTRINAGTGLFGPITTWPMNTCGNGEVAAIDVDDDGDLDITLCEYGGCAGGDPFSGRRVYIRKNDGDGSFQAPYVHIVSGFPERIEGADVDQDGRTDLLVTGNSWIDVSLGNGDGTFQGPLPASCDWGPKGFCVADLDDDGRLDLATTNFGDLGSGGESMSILFGNGDGTFQVPVTKPLSYSHNLGGVGDIVAGDADGDGDLDLMAGNYGSLDVSYFQNRGAGTFAAQQRYGTGWKTVDLVFGDFTGDRRGDLLTQVSFGSGLTFRPALVLLRSSPPRTVR